ncbi:ABC transporter ATP-binding protein [Litorilinea aerophila]|uniref:ABC transporter ATP-binding protein n=1 Tax=Litorilinea aerophila TaxID=1204385 RepID=A0A540VL36_9CHLR|nr:ABC transporter ATP-binding protein [Litorilinea aerophila]MCC9075121.1 ABC transporter ATP-binding protein [Litorilinea aerophila]
MTNHDTLLEINDLRVYFYLDEGTVKAVDGVSFTVKRGQTLCVVGESGCGKSVTARAILNIVPRPGKIVDGEILLHRQKPDGQVEVIDLAALSPTGREIRAIRGAEISMVFQEPMTSFSPVHTIGSQIMEAILLHQDVTKEQARESAVDMLRRCGLPRPEHVVDQYPWELSGGMRQRAMIARALVCRPSLLIADEPTTALDVTTETQILALMRELQQELGMAILFITHDLGVVAEMADEVIVMYLGQVVERADVVSIFREPKHPYTQALLRSIPKIDRQRRKRLDTIEGMVPDPYNIPPGCPFHPRCTAFMPGLCDRLEPPVYDTGDGHLARCLLYAPELPAASDAVSTALPTEREPHG